eukprot:10070054-Heterocapsa_arctica.AAC.1
MGTTYWSASDLYRTVGVLCASQSEDRYLHRGMQQWSWRVENLQESQLLPMQHHRQGGNEDIHSFGTGRHDQFPRKNQGRGCELERDH